MTKRQKNRQHNDQKTEEQTTQLPKDRRTDNTMTKRQKNRQHNGQKTEEQTTQCLCKRRLRIGFYIFIFHVFGINISIR
jgi:hypothetical protein